jgi:hypothetical protein
LTIGEPDVPDARSTFPLRFRSATVAAASFLAVLGGSLVGLQSFGSAKDRAPLTTLAEDAAMAAACARAGATSRPVTPADAAQAVLAARSSRSRVTVTTEPDPYTVSVTVSGPGVGRSGQALASGTEVTCVTGSYQPPSTSRSVPAPEAIQQASAAPTGGFKLSPDLAKAAQRICL